MFIFLAIFLFQKGKKKIGMLESFSVSSWELSLTLQGAGMTDVSCQLAQLAFVNSTFIGIRNRYRYLSLHLVQGYG